MEEVRIRPEAPCQECKERVLGCHDHCDKYMDFRKRQDDYNAYIRFEKVRHYFSFKDNKKQR